MSGDSTGCKLSGSLDGKTYAHEKGDSSVTHLQWDDKTQTLSHEAAAAWTGEGLRNC